MSGKVMGAVWELDLPHSKQSVLLALADHADHEGQNVFAGVGLISWKTGYSERQVQRIMHECVEDGLLVIEEEATPHKPVVYSIDLSKAKRKAEYVRGDKLTEAQRRFYLSELLTKYGPVCQYCHKVGIETLGPDGKAWNIDRIISGANGGHYTPDNITLSCSTCNKKKGGNKSWGAKMTPKGCQNDTSRGATKMTPEPYEPSDQPSDSDSSLRSESGAPADSLGKEIDDLPDSPQLKIAKAAKAIATLSKRSESDLEVPPLRCPVEECGGLLDDQLRCPICNRRYRHDSIAPGALALLFAPGTVVSQGKNTIAIADDKGNLVKPVTDFYVVLDDKAIGPFPSKGKGPSAECARVADRLHGRVSQSPEERPVKAPPGKVKAPPKPRARNALLDKLASLCYGDVDAAFKMRGIPALLNKALGEIKAATPDVSVGKMAAFAFWWYANDWRGIKGQRPEPQQLPGAWLKFMNGDVVNGTNGNRNLDDDAARRSPDFDWGYPKSGMPVMPGNGNAHGSAASQVEPGPERGVPGAGGDHDPA